MKDHLSPSTIRLRSVLSIVLIQLILVAIWTAPYLDGFVRFILMLTGPLICGIAFVIALIFSTRLPRSTGLWIVIAGITMGILAVFLAPPRSGMGYWLYGVPMVMTLIGAALILTRNQSTRTILFTAFGASALGWLGMSAFRVDGVAGNYLPELSPRWKPSTEQALLSAEPVTSPAKIADPRVGETASAPWTGFRGPNRDSRANGIQKAMNWEKNPPREIWRQEVGPAWSSLAIIGDRLFTQEQRGEDEMVTCYHADTGQLIWAHAEKSRFEEMVSGAGPRATPTFAGGNLYTYGARGILLCLDATSGKVLWKRDLIKDVNAALSQWGFSSSPAIFGDLVVVYAGGDGDNGLMAFDRKTGEVRWTLASRGMNFGSAQPLKVNGEEMLVFCDKGLCRGLDPTSGKELWRYLTIAERDPAMVQPQAIGDSGLLVALGDGVGIARIDLKKGTSGWTATQIWRSKSLKPTYNDFVLHGDGIYGFDKSIFAAINASDGSLHWKKGRYGYGQALLLPDASQIIVTTERGEVILLEALPSDLTERGRIKAFEGKTWNHPVINDGRLYVRNSAEMVCYQLPTD